MRKLFIVVILLVLPSSLTACRTDEDGKCKPGAIRQEVSRPERFWVCNKDGTGEDLLTGPIPPANHNWN